MQEKNYKYKISRYKPIYFIIKNKKTSRYNMLTSFYEY